MQKIVLVGQPRSGTSMMMRLLEAGGIDCEYGESKGDKEKFRNIHGFFEIEKPSYTKCFKCWNPSFLHKVPKDWKVIYIERDVYSILQSWKDVNNKNDLKKIKEQVEVRRSNIKRILINNSFDVLKVTYKQVNDNPLEMANKIKDFLHPIKFNAIKASKMVDKNLYKNRQML